MLVQGRRLPDEAAVVVFDEVHYMGDPERGTAWEESILLSPPAGQLICLSATVPNLDEVADWIRAAHGELTTIVHDERAVPLEHRYFVDGKAHLVLDAGGRHRASFKGVGGELARRITRPGQWGSPSPDSRAGIGLDEAEDHGEPASSARDGFRSGAPPAGKPSVVSSPAGRADSSLGSFVEGHRLKMISNSASESRKSGITMSAPTPSRRLRFHSSILPDPLFASSLATATARPPTSLVF